MIVNKDFARVIQESNGDTRSINDDGTQCEN